MSGETGAAGILYASPQKLKQEIAIKITIFARFKAGRVVRGFPNLGGSAMRADSFGDHHRTSAHSKATDCFSQPTCIDERILGLALQKRRAWSGRPVTAFYRLKDIRC